MGSYPARHNAFLIPSTGHPVRPGGNNPDAPNIDSESAALFRAWLRPLVDQATSWHDLAGILDAKGFGLAFREGRLVLTDRDSGARLCTMRFLGTTLRDLVARLGRPMVRAVPGASAAGELMNSARPDGFRH